MFYLLPAICFLLFCLCCVFAFEWFRSNNKNKELKSLLCRARDYIVASKQSQKSFDSLRRENKTLLVKYDAAEKRAVSFEARLERLSFDYKMLLAERDALSREVVNLQEAYNHFT